MDISEILISEKAVNAIEDGQWVRDIIGAPELHLKVRGFSSRKVQAYRDNKLRRVARKDRGADGNPKSEIYEQITRDVLVEVILLDWNITKNGQPVPFSKETAREWLNSRTGDRLVGYITDAVKQVDELQNASAEELEKNSSES